MAASVALLAVFAGRQLPDPAPAAEGTSPASIVAASASVNPALDPVGSPDALRDAVADAGERAPAADASAALAAAVAVAEVPRRAAERRSRAQIQRAASRLQAQREASAQVAIAANAPPLIRLPDAAVATSAVDTHFAMPPATSVAARPWPRALLPTGDRAFTVGFGQVAREPGFEPFRPREVAGSVTAPASDVPPRTAPSAQGLSPLP